MNGFSKILTELLNSSMLQSNEKLKKKRSETRFLGESGGGLVKVVIDGNDSPVSLNLSETLQGQQISLISDLIFSALVKVMENKDDQNTKDTTDQLDLSSLFSGMNDFSKIFSDMKEKLIQSKEKFKKQRSEARFTGEAGGDLVRIIIDGNNNPVSVELSAKLQKETISLIRDLAFSALIKASEEKNEQNLNNAKDNIDIQSLLSNIFPPKK